MFRSNKKLPVGLPAGVTAPKGEWIDRNGVTIPIRNMTTKHLEATIAMLRHRADDPEFNCDKIEELNTAIRNRYITGDYYTGATNDFTPFSLGMKNEVWTAELPALFVGSYGPVGEVKNVFVTKVSLKIKPYAVITGCGRLATVDREWNYFDDILMTVAWVQYKLTSNEK